MAIMSSAPTSRTPSSSSTKSSPPSCATNWSPTTSPTSVLRRDWTIEGTGPSRCRSRALPNHHRPLRRFPGAMAQRPRRLSAAAAPRPADHHWRGPLSWNQDPQPARHPPARSAAPWRQPRRRLDGQADPPRRPNHLPPLRQRLPPQPTALRPAQAEGPRPAAAGRLPLRLPSHPQRVQVALLFLFFHKRLCSSTNASAARSPIAASTTAPTPITRRPASSKPPTTTPTTPFNRSSICWPPDLSLPIVRLFFSAILRARI